MLILLRAPVTLVQRMQSRRAQVVRSRGQGVVAEVPRQLLGSLERGDPHAGQVDVLVEPLAQAAHLDRTVAAYRVLDDAVAVGLGGEAPRPRLPVGGPERAHRRVVARGAPVLPERDHPVRGRVGVVVRIGVVGEPRHPGRRLADLVGDLAVGALILRQEAQTLRHQRGLAGGVHRERVDGGVSTEEPPEARPVAAAARPPSRHQPAPEVGVADALFLEIDFGPLQRQVERVVGRVDRRHRGQHGVRPGTVAPIDAAGIGKEPVVGGEDRVTGLGARRDGDRDEFVADARRVHMDRHRGRSLRDPVRGQGLAVRGPRRPDDRVVLLQALTQDECPVPRVPEDVLASERRGPHVLERGLELHQYVQGLEGPDVQEHQDARLVAGREDRLLHRERRVAVRDGGALGAHLDPARNVLAGERLPVLRDLEPQLEIGGHFQGMHPELGRSGLRAEPGAPRTGNAEVHAGAHRVRQRDRGSHDREARHARMRRVGRHRDASHLGRRGRAGTESDRQHRDERDRAAAGGTRHADPEPEGGRDRDEAHDRSFPKAPRKREARSTGWL